MNIHHMSLAVIFLKTFADPLNRFSVLLLDIANLVIVKPLLTLDGALAWYLLNKLFRNTKHALKGTLPFNILRSVYSYLNRLFICSGSVVRMRSFMSLQLVLYGKLRLLTDTFFALTSFIDLTQLSLFFAFENCFEI